MTVDDPLRLERVHAILDGPQKVNNEGTIYRSPGGHIQVHRVSFEPHGYTGAALYFSNPPMNTLGTDRLEEYVNALSEIGDHVYDLSFLVTYGPNTRYHSGADIDQTIERLAALDSGDVSVLDAIEERVGLGIHCDKLMKDLSEFLVTASVSGAQYLLGGSAEFHQMPEFAYLGTETHYRFPEVTLGFPPGWVSPANLRMRTNAQNVAALTMSGKAFSAHELHQAGVIDLKVETSPHPRDNDPEYDTEAHAHLFINALDDIHHRLSSTVGSQVNDPDEVDHILIPEAEFWDEIVRRSDPRNYATYVGKPVKDVKSDADFPGVPLYRPAVDALNTFIGECDPTGENHQADAERGKELILDFYTNHTKQVLAGLRAAKNRVVADFSEK